MRSNKTALGIDITDGLINLALLEKTSKGIKVLKAARCPAPDGVIKDGNIIDAVALAKAIKKLKTKNRMHSQHCAMSMIANPVLIQILDLPKNFTGNVRQFVNEQVKQCAILPIRKAAVDFCGIKPSANTANQRVLVVATDTEKIMESSKQLSRANLKIDAIEPASLAYLRACYAKKIAGNFDHNFLFALIRKNAMILYLFRNETLDMVRIKRFGHDNCCAFLEEEINTVLKFYELEVPDSSDKWEITIINSTYDKYVAEEIKLLTTRLGVDKAEVINIQDASFDMPIEKAKRAYKPSAVAIGLAMKLLDPTAGNLNINLLPTEAVEIRAQRKHTLVIANAAAAVFLMIILCIGFFNMHINKVNRRIKQKQQELVIKNTQDLVNEKISLNEQISQVSKKIKAAEAVLNNDALIKWEQILSEITLATPKAVRITNFSSSKGRKILIQGQALSYDGIHLFVDMLNKCKNIDTALLDETIRDKKSKELLAYTIKCSLAKP